ncbi:MAG: hypothetical protein LBV60_16440, partial [Streptomyces sp.]|nr:hypothetical protein [Streptomyces sp.]
SINTVTWVIRIAVFVVPVAAFEVTRRICHGLQRKDRELVEHGRETGIIKRLPNGEYVEVVQPLSAAQRYTLTAHQRELPPPGRDLQPADTHPAVDGARVGAGQEEAEV